MKSLNWKELKILCQEAHSSLAQSKLAQVIIPRRNSYEEGYSRGEWAFRLRTQDGERTLVIGLISGNPYICLYPKGRPKSFGGAHRSPFLLELTKQLENYTLTEIVAITKDRRCRLVWESNDLTRLELLIELLPKQPNALLTDSEGKILTDWNMKFHDQVLKPPQPGTPPEAPPVREFIENGEFALEIDDYHQTAATDSLVVPLKKLLTSKIKQTQRTHKKLLAGIESAQSEDEFKKMGDLLKGALYQNPKPKENSKAEWGYDITDLVTDRKVWIPADQDLGPTAQVEKFYQKAKKARKKREENEERVQKNEKIFHSLEEDLKKVQLLEERPDSAELKELAKKYGLIKEEVRVKTKAGASWKGKKFITVDQLAVWVGRSSDENHSLTFRHAKGNDIWFHVKGRAGAHAVLFPKKGKSPPLESLLDAAQLVLYFSGGKNWGKTEVDYTQVKHVKKIKGSVEVNYSQNKTLLVEGEEERLNRLLGKM